MKNLLISGHEVAPPCCIICGKAKPDGENVLDGLHQQGHPAPSRHRSGRHARDADRSVSRLRRMFRRVQLEILRVRAAALRCPDCAHRNVIAIDDRGQAYCTHCGHRPFIDLLK